MQHPSLEVKSVIRTFVLDAVLELTNHQSRAVAAVTAGICCDCRGCIAYVPLH